MENTLYYGDNLDVLREHVRDESVDLIYLDPPFNSKASYNVLFKSPKGHAVRAQADVFEDTWHWGDAAELAFHQVMAAGGDTAGILHALRGFLGETDMMAYLTNMAVRLAELRRILKPTGTIYLHCDPTASHYLKVILDGTFTPQLFQNEIVWQRTNAKSHAYTRFPSAHDVILSYRKSEGATWNTIYLPHSEKYIKSHYSNIEKGTGRRYTLGDCLNPNRNRPNLTYEWRGQRRVWRWTREKMQALHDEGRLVYTKSGMPRYKRYLDEMKGTPATSVWTDIPPINSQARERLGFATQKPLALLERIIAASSNPEDVILDPFCGCGTAVHAAHKTGRQWIGIDITHVAIQIVEGRLKSEFPQAKYQVIGHPKDLESALDLADRDKHEFQLWIAAQLGATPEAIKKGPDRGIDGYIWFLRSASESDFAILSVKGGKNIGVSMIRDLRGAMEREGAGAGVFACIGPPTKDMVSEAAAAGVLETVLGPFPRLQILTVQDIVNGKRPNLPPTYDFATLLTLPRVTGKAKQSDPAQLRKQLALLLPLINKRLEDLSHVSPEDLTLPELAAAG